MDNYANSTHWVARGPLNHPGGGCWTCQHWRGEFSSEGAHIVCRDKYGPTLKAMPDAGCAFWEREPGADDEIVYGAERCARGWFAPELSAPAPIASGSSRG